MIPTSLWRTREDLPQLLNYLKLTGQGAEIGVYAGDFSEHIRRHWRGHLLFCIDEWKHQLEGCEGYATNVDNDTFERLYQKVKLMASKYPGAVELIRDSSRSASKRFIGGKLDFVYIDANHSYDSVMEDIRLWWPTLAAGGLMAGHDYGRSCDNYSVRRAVTAWAAEAGKPVHVTGPGDYNPSWLIEKR